MRILFGIFDWGFGHATRDTPIIDALLKKGHSVDIICTGKALALLKKIYGDRCAYHDVPSVVSPFTSSRFFMAGFMYRMPSMLMSLRKARRISAAIIKKGDYDRVISDCRYDVYDRVDNSFLINHQLRFKSVPGAEHFAEKWLARRMSRYGKVMVPDFPGRGIAGRLCHDLRYYPSSRIEYIGVLSHVRRQRSKKDVDYFISLSGVEPQRTILEKEILSQVSGLKGNIVVAAANPDAPHMRKEGGVTIYGFLQPHEQAAMMNRAKCIVTRSGYTTLMEVCELGIEKALLIPTPGHTEQEYLADFHAESGAFARASQHKLDLVKDVGRAMACTGWRCPWTTGQTIKNVIRVIDA
jgi:hypothetical protein